MLEKIERGKKGHQKVRQRYHKKRARAEGEKNVSGKRNRISFPRAIFLSFFTPFASSARERPEILTKIFLAEQKSNIRGANFSAESTIKNHLESQGAVGLGNWPSVSLRTIDGEAATWSVIPHF